MDERDLAHDLTIMLMYLTSWREKAPGGEICRTWRGYDEDILDHLRDEGLISFSRKAKSVTLTPDGEQAAKMLVNVYGSLISDFQRQVREHLEETAPKSDVPAFRFRVTLELGEGHDCWRELVVPQDFSFSQLHEVIQAAFLWWDYHLYDFRLTSRREKLMLVDPTSGGVDSMFDPGARDARMVDSRDVPLSQVFPRTCTATYSYDYGDGWEHKVKLVETIACYEGQMPVCTDGAGDAPPEDVGGPGGFEGFLRVMDDPSDPDHEETVAWAKSQFFEPFSLGAVNERIRKWRDGSLFLEWGQAHPEDTFAGDGMGMAGGERGGSSALKLVP